VVREMIQMTRTRVTEASLKTSSSMLLVFNRYSVLIYDTPVAPRLLSKLSLEF
jgi:hypothetical protein